jgi:pimeloyl-ACP methyl ester carboxylesterase
VVAPDYRGLGTEGPHQYVNKLAQGYDVIFAVPAARKAVPSLGADWVVDGHSQGGTAAWSVAEMEPSRHDPGYLGAVAVAPASRLEAVMSVPAPTTAANFYIDFMAYALWARTPSFHVDQMLTGNALARYPDLTTKGCFYYAYAAFLGDDSPRAVTPGWQATPAAKTFFRESSIGDAPIAGPLLVVAGEADQTVPITAVHEVVRVACANGQSLQFRSYPGLDHDPTMDKSTPDQLAWIGDRFAGKPAANGCPAHGGAS